jgi:hypothetical protein
MGKAGRVKASKAAIRDTLKAEHVKQLTKFFAAQKAATGSSFDPSQWDGDLASLLHTLSAATAEAIGKKVSAELGGTWSADSIAAYLKSNSEATAKKINQTTADEITAALEAQDDPNASPEDAIGGVFDGEVAARAGQISASRVAMVAGLASLVAARLSNARTKTWVTGGNPRSLHSEMDGETVPLGELFSNGMDGPGDFSGGVDEVACCNCELSFEMEG